MSINHFRKLMLQILGFVGLRFCISYDLLIIRLGVWYKYGTNLHFPISKTGFSTHSESISLYPSKESGGFHCYDTTRAFLFSSIHPSIKNRRTVLPCIMDIFPLPATIQPCFLTARPLARETFTYLIQRKATKLPIHFFKTSWCAADVLSHDLAAPLWSQTFGA